MSQADVKPKGWAIESRIYAEDPTRGFLPSIGRLVRYRPPAEGARERRDVRIDSGVREGDEISMFYDPMIAKLCMWGDADSGDRGAGRRARDFHIEGVGHNSLPVAVMDQERFRAGRLSTGYIAEEFLDGFSPLAVAGETRTILAAVAAHVDHVQNLRKREISGQLREAAKLRFELKRAVILGGTRIDVAVEPREGGADIAFADGRRLRVESAWTPGEPVWRGASTTSRSRCRCARSSTASRSPIAASPSRRASTLAAKPRSPR